METEPSSRPKLPLLFSMKSEPVGMVDSPIHTSASVPFRWEEEPGKPRHSTSNLLPSKSLELPPRLMFNEFSKMTKLPSPNMVLDGPSIMSKSSRFSSFSFRISRVSQGHGWSFDTNTNPSPSCSIMSKKTKLSSSSFRLLREGQGQLWSFDTAGSNTSPQDEGGFLGSRGQGALQHNIKGRKGEKDVGDNLVFSSSIEDQAWKLERVARNQSLSRVRKPRSHFWVTICRGIKQIFPMRKRDKT